MFKAITATVLGLVSAQVSHAFFSTDPLRNSLSDQACNRIDAIYSMCGKKFDYNGRDFVFTLPTGKRTVFCSDGRKLGFYDRIDDMDVASTFMFPYEMGNTARPEKRRNWDPGRLRQEDLLKSVYGHDSSSVSKNLVKVSFLNQTIPFNKHLGAAQALSKAGKEIMAEAKRDQAVAKFIEMFTSRKQEIYTFTWRVVAGTNRLSPHSFGTGIDILTNIGPQYWLWDEKRTNPEKAKKGEQAYRNDHYIPPGPPIFNQKVVDILERNGFVWGGKWNHYDTMHFEYRPEFIPGFVANCTPVSLFSSRAEKFEAYSEAELAEYVERVSKKAHRHEH